jgi:UDP-N-acetylglucosamine transferase subunit ALG13
VIFVTVGTHTAPFDRLVRAGERYAATSGERVVVQRGASRYLPVVAESFTFCESGEMERLIRASRVVVCHAADTILDAIRLGRPVVAVPRRRCYSEHLNDHQVHLAAALAGRSTVVALDDLGELPAAIDRAADLGPPMWPGEPPLAAAIRTQLSEWFPAMGSGRQPSKRPFTSDSAAESRVAALEDR